MALQRWRITIRNDGPNRLELRGYLNGSLDNVRDLAQVFKPWALVIASPAEPDYDPFDADA